jgi:hypothetical protein
MLHKRHKSQDLVVFVRVSLILAPRLTKIFEEHIQDDHLDIGTPNFYLREITLGRRGPKFKPHEEDEGVIPSCNVRTLASLPWDYPSPRYVIPYNEILKSIEPFREVYYNAILGKVRGHVNTEDFYDMWSFLKAVQKKHKDSIAEFFNEAFLTNSRYQFDAETGFDDYL